MWLKIKRLEIYLARGLSNRRELFPKVALGGDPVGQTLWVWWLGYELVATLLSHQRKENEEWTEQEGLGPL